MVTLTPKVGGASQWGAHPRDPCVAHCLLPQLLGEGWGQGRLLPHLLDRDLWWERREVGRSHHLLLHRRLTQREASGGAGRVLGCLWRRGLDAECGIGGEAQRAQGAGQLRLAEALARESLEEGE